MKPDHYTCTLLYTNTVRFVHTLIHTWKSLRSDISARTHIWTGLTFPHALTYEQVWHLHTHSHMNGSDICTHTHTWRSLRPDICARTHIKLWRSLRPDICAHTHTWGSLRPDICARNSHKIMKKLEAWHLRMHSHMKKFETWHLHTLT